VQNSNIVFINKRKDISLIHLKVDGRFVMDPEDMTDTSSNHIKSVFNSSCLSLRIL
jgi:hypothetical protein